jgi:hypothetical protein
LALACPDLGAFGLPVSIVIGLSRDKSSGSC